MSSPKAQSLRPAAKAAPRKAVTAKKPKPAAAVADEPTRAEKAAFLKAMVQGIKPGSKAAEKSAARKGPEAARAAKAAAAPKSEAPAARKVEVLRRISGTASIPVTAESERVLALAKELEATLADGRLDALQPHAMQALMAALCKIYSAQDEADMRYPVLSGRGAVTGTDVMIVCGALLRAVDLQVFELGMWQSWSGR